MKFKEMNLSFGQKFWMLRQIVGRSETETAYLLKKSLGSYLKHENDFLFPTETLLRRVAKLYGLSYQELLEFGE